MNIYRSYALNKAKDAFSEGRVRQILTKHAIRNKFRVRDIQSSFKRQIPRLLECLRINRSMKLHIRTEALFEKPEDDDGGGNEIGSQELIYIYMLYLQPALISVMRMD